MHVFVSVGMAMVVSVIVSVSVSVVKCHYTHEVDQKSSETDNEQLANAVHLAAGGQSFDCLVDDLNTDDPFFYTISIACVPAIHDRQTYMRNMPLAKPDNVSTFP